MTIPWHFLIVCWQAFVAFGPEVYASGAFSRKKHNTELSAARSLANLHTIFRRPNRAIPIKKLVSINRHLKKSQLFRPYSYLARNALKFSSNKNSPDRLKQCLHFAGKKEEQPLKHLFHQKIGRYCRKRFLKDFKKIPGKKKYLPIIAKNIDLFLTENIVKDLRKMLRRFEDTSPVTISISNAIKNHCIKNNILPSKIILPAIIPDPLFTGFIQKQGFFNKTSEKYFHREFEYALEDIRQNYKQQDPDKVRTTIKSAIDFYGSNQKYLSDQKTRKFLNRLGKRMIYRNQQDLALELFRASEDIVIGHDETELNFQRLFILLLKGRIDEGIDYLRKQNIIEEFSKLSNKFKFWIARTYELNKEYPKAKQLYLKIIREDPLSFYSINSLDRLKKFQSNYNYNILIDDKELMPQFQGKFNLTSKRHLQKMVWFARIDHSLFLSMIANHLFEQPLDKVYLSEAKYPVAGRQQLGLSIINILNRNNQHLEAFKFAFKLVKNDIVPLNDYLLKIIFPYRFLGQIKKSSSLLDPLVVLSLIRQESAFNPRASSRAGALGLMQILPSTARQYRRRLSSRKLYNPKINLKIGIKYLEKLIRDNKGNLIFALSAYNAGEGNLAQWKRSVLKYDQGLHNIEMIPFPETQNYVKLIYRNMYFYNILSENDEFLKKDTEDNLQITI